ncbi:MAG: hypothetical protein N5P05_003237 [Chroococcopsis gigantea SAG 12.99]|jgi:rod shape-determining protein MreC|nr:rod shape-determining protein MreC [Chlorogloea purpurea SAG 13.99]MDV3001631.1 hypothetical protein [Chroococcopsis gigantea SAG 12.99]
MYTPKRRWTQRGLRLLFVGLALLGAWVLRQTNGALILELYAFITRPFQSNQINSGQILTNKRTQELESRLTEVEKENQQLKQLLGYYESQKTPVITAPIIGRSPDNWWQKIFIGRGSKDGVQKDAVVTGIGGLVGRVTNVTPNTSEVLLVSNTDSNIGATVSRSRSMGLIEGQGDQIAVMRFFEKVPDVRPGDIVTTSAVSRLFPSGIPIGRVLSVAPSKGPAPEAKVEFIAPVNNIEWVLIHPLPHP